MAEIYKKREFCAICKNSDLKVVLEYGKVPLAGDFPLKDDLEQERLFDLNIEFCDGCGLLQTDSIIDAESLFLDYRYMSSIGLSKHFEDTAIMLTVRFNLDKNSQIIEIGSNDGVLLEPLMKLGLDPLGFEPAINIAKVAKDKGCNVFNTFFNKDTAKEHLVEGNTDLIISNNCFAHIDDIHSVVEGVKYALKDDGYFVFEVSYAWDLIDKLQYDNIYHEHIYYYTLNAVFNLFNRFDMTVVDFDRIPIHAGSIRVYVRNKVVPPIENAKVITHLMVESQLGLTKLDYFQSFASRVEEHSGQIKLFLERNSDKKIVGYGASGRANMLCNICDITPDQVSYIVDESPERVGRYIAGKRIPIVGPEVLEKDPPDLIFIFAWNFAKMIMSKLEGRGYRYIIPFPKPIIIEKYEELKDFISI